MRAIYIGPAQEQHEHYLGYGMTGYAKHDEDVTIFEADFEGMLMSFRVAPEHVFIPQQ